ncbi:class III lanthipeptide [Pseudoalteromonas sp. DL2-H2.2]|nr:MULTISPECIES: class III lanthipeptide [Pseudoalteromonas]MCF2910423.1 class III lanthipeptide [Pseudoalteromonas sp. DL2-H2.2]MCF2910424.1 class III lanthipeptide [Pseudoalteromonas sp. DL2-H2.2]MCF2910425.1 class III lanthipeptide [Pseudoalteromonas sp. DL2-H2.2]
MNNVLKLQAVAAGKDSAEIQEWSTISNHCGSSQLK